MLPTLATPDPLRPQVKNSNHRFAQWVRAWLFDLCLSDPDVTPHSSVLGVPTDVRKYLDTVRARPGSDAEICHALTLANKKGEPRTQCTRKCLPGQSFCGTHLKKHVEGRLGPDDVVTSSGTLDGAAPGDASGGATEDATTVEDALLCQIADEIGDEEGAEERE